MKAQRLRDNQKDSARSDRFDLFRFLYNRCALGVLAT